MDPQAFRFSEQLALYIDRLPWLMSTPGSPGQRGGYVGLSKHRSVSNGPGRRMRMERMEEGPTVMTPREAPPAEARSPRMASPGQSPGGRKSIQIHGCTGKYSLINDIYEPLEYYHQNKPCWRARSGGKGEFG